MSKFTNSPLVEYTRISPNKNDGRWDWENNKPVDKITKITIHHMAGVATLEQFGNIVANPARQMSANYAIDKDARVGLFCEEKDRSWCSSSKLNDNVAITIEVSNSSVGGNWPISDKVLAKLIDLCVDICKRNGIPKLTFTGNKNGSLTYHYMFSQTSCLPINETELLTPSGWKRLEDIKLGDVVATVHVDTLGIKFDEVENIIPVKTQDTYVTRDFEATSDHRIVYYNQARRQYIGLYKDIYDMRCSIYLPSAGFIENPTGFRKLGAVDIDFLVAVQADGHYMKDNDYNSYYGVEFHVKKERKIKRLMRTFELLNFKYTMSEQSDGSVKLRLYGKDFVDKCEEYLDNKRFTWDWLNMDRKQVEWFMESILQYDGCEANKSYASSIQQNVDVVQAIAAINGIGTKMSKEHDRVYFKKFMRSLGDNIRTRKQRQKVSCVTVRSGFILVRQHGRTTITGNCPGPYIKSKTQYICDQVNKRLTGTSNTAPSGTKVSYVKQFNAGTVIYKAPGGYAVNTIKTYGAYTIVEESVANGIKYGKLKSGIGWVKLGASTTSTAIKKGDIVKVLDPIIYGTNKRFTNISNKYYVLEVSGSRAVISTNNKDVTAAIDVKYLQKI